MHKITCYIFLRIAKIGYETVLSVQNKFDVQKFHFSCDEISFHFIGKFKTTKIMFSGGIQFWNVPDSGILKLNSIVWDIQAIAWSSIMRQT